jgi:hypothetical protein
LLPGESWGIKKEKRSEKRKEKGMNGLDSLVGRLMFIEKLPVGWGRADVCY